MKKLLLLLLPVVLMMNARAQEASPNPKLSLDPELVDLVCLSAKVLGRNEYKSNLNSVITPFEQFLLLIEGYEESDVIAMGPEKTYTIIRDAWDSKWSKCYCSITSAGDDGHVDMLLLKSLQFPSVWNIYNPQGKIKANVNRVTKQYGDIGKDMTLLDLIEVNMERWVERGGILGSYAKRIISFSDEYLLQNGAKKFVDPSANESQLTPAFGSFKDSRDGRLYKTVSLSDPRSGRTLTIMAENLDYKMDSTYVYDGIERYRTTYGLLYPWRTAQEACPNGWHLPSDEEWSQIIALLGGESEGGKVMKATVGWAEERNGTNESGFAALPGGMGQIFKEYSGNNAQYRMRFSNVGDFGYWWSSSTESAEAFMASKINLCFYFDRVYKEHKSPKHNAHSVRCIKD